MKVTLASLILGLLHSTAVQAQFQEFFKEFKNSSLAPLTGSCNTALISLAGPIGPCSNILSLLPVLVTSGSVVAPFDRFLGVACGTTCVPKVIDDALETITKGCEKDLSDNSLIVNVLTFYFTHYTETNNLICLLEKDNHQFCLPQLGSSIESSTKTIITITTIADIFTKYDKFAEGFSNFIKSIPASTICTDCFHGITTYLGRLLPEDVKEIGSSASDKCRKSEYADGKLPDSVGQYGFEG